MVIDIHKAVISNPISRNLLKPWGSFAKPNSLRSKLFNKYTDPGNPIEKQVDFNPYTGQIYKVHDPPLSNNDRCSMLHDIDYTVAQNILFSKCSSINNIMINDKDLNKGILRIRYLNNRKLTNNLLKHDYKISKNMVNAIKFNKDLHKLSKNEMKIYHELQKFLSKEQDINVLIGSYLPGNNSKKLYNKISSMLYNKLKDNIISKKEYTKLINKINKE